MGKLLHIPIIGTQFIQYEEKQNHNNLMEQWIRQYIGSNLPCKNVPQDPIGICTAACSAVHDAQGRRVMEQIVEGQKGHTGLHEVDTGLLVCTAEVHNPVKSATEKRQLVKTHLYKMMSM